MKHLKKHTICSKDEFYRKLQSLHANGVIYIETGGKDLGISISNALNIPAYGINIRYPLSRLMDQYFLLKPILWLVKEIIYKLTYPSWDSTCLPNTLKPPIILVDDRISSLKTVQVAKEVLKTQGIMSCDLFVVTSKCSKKAQSEVHLILPR